jgi:adenine specific DNA methylase Mod
MIIVLIFVLFNIPLFQKMLHIPKFYGWKKNRFKKIDDFKPKMRILLKITENRETENNINRKLGFETGTFVKSTLYNSTKFHPSIQIQLNNFVPNFANFYPFPFNILFS